MQCPQCESHDIYSVLLWPRENMQDLSCDCMDCGCLFDVIDGKAVIEQEGWLKDENSY